MEQIRERGWNFIISLHGEGTIKIVGSCRQNSLPKSDFIEEHGVMKVISYKDIYNEEYLIKSVLMEE
ncbi:MAG TPA: hypothetical protein ENG74_00035 [Thermoplasmatales archaeon]|nr:hypothetical protein [Thermoplasmatales archaeon]